MKRILSILGLVAVFGLIFVALVTSSVKKPDLSEAVWNENMVLGDTESPTRHYVVYTDIMCPYCNYYAKIIKENDEEFTNFLKEHRIAYELRVTDMLYEGNNIEMSRPAAEAAYCAADEGKFWDFYHKSMDKLFEEYYEKGIGNSKTAPKISDMTREYWKNIGKEVGLGESFEECFTNRRKVSEIEENTRKASYTASGLPYYVFGKFTTGGFDPTWDWTIVRQMLEAGL